jgi:hypothetical protein
VVFSKAWKLGSYYLVTSAALLDLDLTNFGSKIKENGELLSLFINQNFLLELLIRKHK